MKPAEWAIVWRLAPLVKREWALHPWRHGAALLAVALGVALAWSVHLINHSALAEFGAAVRQANGQPDLSLRTQREGFDDAWLDRVQADPAVALATPVLEVETHGRSATGARRFALRVIGVDALAIAAVAPELLPRPAGRDDGDRWSVFDPLAVFANAAAREALAGAASLEVQSGPRWVALSLAGDVAAGGRPLLVMDIAGAQQHFGLLGRLTRIDIRLAAGADAAALLQRLALPPSIRTVDAAAGEQRISNLSRAYRVNLTVLALVALFVGAFLVFAVVALGVAQRTPGFALLAVLGLTAGERRALVLAESALLGAAGSAAGLLLGAGLAAGVLRWLGGDLGGGYFPGVAPRLALDASGALLFFALGVTSSVAGAWVPAQHAQRLRPAVALKGFGDGGPARRTLATPLMALALIAAAVALALLPPVAGLPLAAYASVAALLFGGVALVPSLLDIVLRWLPQPRRALPLLALRRARAERHTATAAVAGVVASLALATALTVMVASFRDGVARWLEQVLPADLYARSAATSAQAEQAWFDEAALARVAALPGVARVAASRARSLQLDPAQPAVVLHARPLGSDAAKVLPMVTPPLAAAPGEIGVYASEAMVARYAAAPGSELTLPLGERGLRVRVLGVWRDYARQFGTLAVDLADYRRATGDQRLTDLALWLAPGAALDEVSSGLRATMGDAVPLEMAGSGELRALSLRIFDRSFAVTRYLQGVAVVIGLAGIAASFSAQVLARRKEFGLLAHIGFTRRQVLALVGAEALAWMAAGVALGVALGVAVSVVLVKVVNPQSFHWTMELVLPLPQLAALALLVLAAGVATAVASARGATQRAAVLAVKEDW
jgi:putative ABC transport system permease protein